MARGIAENSGAHGANMMINYRTSEEAAAETVAAEDAGGAATDGRLINISPVVGDRATSDRRITRR